MLNWFKKPDPESRQLLQYIQNKFAVKPKNLTLYRDALRHKSVAKESNKSDNERLEFLGDAVLDIIIAEKLYEVFPKKTEGELTQIKSRIVNRKKLGKIGLALGLDKKVRFVDGKYVNKQTICGNALEAIVGAIYMDLGFDKAKQSVRYVLSVTVDLNSIAVTDSDYKSQILVWSQKNKRPIEFEMENVDDLGHEKMYFYSIKCGDEILGRGQGKSKKKAEQAASKSALDGLGLLD